MTKPKTYIYKGVEGTVAELMRRFDVKLSEMTVRTRLRKGATIAHAFESPVKHDTCAGRIETIDGITATLKEHCERLGTVSLDTARQRINRGESPAQAVKRGPAKNGTTKPKAASAIQVKKRKHLEIEPVDDAVLEEEFKGLEASEKTRMAEVELALERKQLRAQVEEVWGTIEGVEQ